MVVRQIGTIERKMLRVRQSSASRYNALLLDLIVHLIVQRVSPVNAWRMPGTREGGRMAGCRRLAHFGTDAQKGGPRGSASR